MDVNEQKIKTMSIINFRNYIESYGRSIFYCSLTDLLKIGVYLFNKDKYPGLGRTITILDKGFADLYILTDKIFAEIESDYDVFVAAERIKPLVEDYFQIIKRLYDSTLYIFGSYPKRLSNLPGSLNRLLGKLKRDPSKYNIDSRFKYIILAQYDWAILLKEIRDTIEHHGGTAIIYKMRDEVPPFYFNILGTNRDIITKDKGLPIRPLVNEVYPVLPTLSLFFRHLINYLEGLSAIIVDISEEINLEIFDMWGPGESITKKDSPLVKLYEAYSLY